MSLDLSRYPMIGMYICSDSQFDGTLTESQKKQLHQFGPDLMTWINEQKVDIIVKRKPNDPLSDPTVILSMTEPQWLEFILRFS